MEREIRIRVISLLCVLSGVKKQALLVVEQKKAELAQWIAKCNDGSAKLQKINEAIS
jgi:hypothetical protein